MFVFHLLGSDAYHQSKQIVTFGALQCGNQLKHASQIEITNIQHIFKQRHEN